MNRDEWIKYMTDMDAALLENRGVFEIKIEFSDMRKIDVEEKQQVEA